MPMATSPVRGLLQNHTAVRRRRVLARLQQCELALKAEISASHMSKIEGGKKSASVDVLHRLATALDCPVEELMAE